MAKDKRKPDSGMPATVTPEDVRRVLGDIDDDKLLAILDLQPTVEDLERAALYLGGDPDVFGAGDLVKGTASNIVTILTADEEEALRAH